MENFTSLIVMAKFDDLYHNLDKPTAYSSTSILKRKGGKEYLKGEDGYTLHKSYRKTYPRRKVVGLGVNHSVHADLADFGNVSSYNRNVRFLLVVVDNYSRFCHVQPVADKSAVKMVEATSKIFDAMKKRYGAVCDVFISDDGREFFSSTMSKLMEENHVTHFSTSSGMKACMAERQIRTIKGRLYRYFTANNTLKWIDVIQKIVDGVNNTVNRTIKMAPSRVRQGDVDETIETAKEPVETVKVGDTVRISRARRTFDKGYLPSWTTELFIVKEVKNKFNPPYLKLVDMAGEEITGTFYYPEVQLVIDKGLYKISKVLERKKIRGKDMAYVSWFGYPDSFNQWVDAKDVVLL